MRIAHEDPNLMIIKGRNILAFFVGTIFAVVGFLIIFSPHFFNNNPPMWYGIIGILVGLFVIFSAKVATITLDKNMNRLVFVWKTLLNQKTKEYELNQIKEIELQHQRAYSFGLRQNTQSRNSYRLVFVLGNGQEIPLNPGGSTKIRIMGKQITSEKAIGERVANFLSIPFEEKRPPTVREVLSCIRETVIKEMKKAKREKKF